MSGTCGADDLHLLLLGAIDHRTVIDVSILVGESLFLQRVFDVVLLIYGPDVFFDDMVVLADLQ